MLKMPAELLTSLRVRPMLTKFREDPFTGSLAVIRV